MTQADIDASKTPCCIHHLIELRSSLIMARPLF